VERCERRRARIGNGFRVTNILRGATLIRRKMRAAKDPIGDENDSAICAGAAWADVTICGWGPTVNIAIVAQMSNAFACQWCKPSASWLTKAGHPKHPLYPTQQPDLWLPPYDPAQLTLVNHLHTICGFMGARTYDGATNWCAAHGRIFGAR
jgi:hypothetical protein